jgi:hypothetical protein
MDFSIASQISRHDCNVDMRASPPYRFFPSFYFSYVHSTWPSSIIISLDAVKLFSIGFVEGRRSDLPTRQRLQPKKRAHFPFGEQAPTSNLAMFPIAVSEVMSLYLLSQIGEPREMTSHNYHMH